MRQTRFLVPPLLPIMLLLVASVLVVVVAATPADTAAPARNTAPPVPATGTGADTPAAATGSDADTPASPTRVATATPVPASHPVGQRGSWHIIFDDEFNGRSLDLSKWRPNWLGSSDTAITPPVNKGDTSCYDPQQVREGQHELDLTAVARSCKGYPYASGMIQSNGRFKFTFGYMEARIWIPAGRGIRAAFWSNGHKWPQDGEIDVVETHGTDDASYHYHYAGCGGDCGPGGLVTVHGATSGWHTYAADWIPGAITWYYDGRKVWRYTKTISSSRMYLIVNLGLHSLSSKVPATMRVDYVRVWQRLTTKLFNPRAAPYVPTSLAGAAGGARRGRDG